MPRPDLTVLIELEEEERVRRLLGRGSPTDADIETLDPAFREVVLGHLRREADVRVDVTALDRDQAWQRVFAAIGPVQAWRSSRTRFARGDVGLNLPTSRTLERGVTSTEEGS